MIISWKFFEQLSRRFQFYSRMKIVIDEKKNAFDDFRVMISSDKINYKELFDSIVL